MKQKITLFILLTMVLSSLQACSSEAKPSPSKTQSSTGTVVKSEDGNSVIQEMTLRIEDEVSDQGDYYVFNGFIGEDTLSFEYETSRKTIQSFHPAQIGYKFKFKKLKRLKQAEIIDFNRKEGYVKLRLEVGK